MRRLRGREGRTAARTSRSWIVPLFVASAMVLGGSSSSGYMLAFYTISSALLIYGLVSFEWTGSVPGDPLLLAIGIGSVALILIQLIPLPPAIWSQMPGRSIVSEGYKLLGVSPPWLPSSLTPTTTFAAFSILIPTSALILLAGRISQLPARSVANAILAVTALSVVLGIAQAQGDPQSGLYIHKFTARGLAVGFFANPNHLATLLLISILLFAASIRYSANHNPVFAKFGPFWVIGAGIAAGIVIFLTASMAGFLLLLPAVAAGLVLVGLRGRLVILSGVLAAIIAALIAYNTNWEDGSVPVLTSFGTSELDRRGIYATAIEAITAYWPIGSGFGSFEQVYRLHEDSATLSSKYVNHAHNDYIELVMEGGLAGAILIAAFLSWWAINSVRAWRRIEESAIWGKTASVIVGLVLLHSIVDYPLRTPAIATIFMFFVLLLAHSGTRKATEAAHTPSASD